MTDAQKKLVEDNLPLAYWYAHKWRNRLIEEEDREQIAMLGMCKAAIAYDPSRGAFSTVAAKYMRLALLGAWGRKEKHPRVNSLDFTFVVGFKFKEPKARPEHTEKTVTIQDFIADKTDINDLLYASVIRDTIETLLPRHQEAVRLMLQGYKQYEAAQIMGVSRQRISAILTEVKPKIYAAVGR